MTFGTHRSSFRLPSSAARVLTLSISGKIAKKKLASLVRFSALNIWEKLLTEPSKNWLVQSQQ